MLFIVMIFYTFVGYPLLLKLWLKASIDSSSHNCRVRLQCDYKKEISVLLVACNEAETIRKKIENIFSFNYEKNKIKLFIVDDASDDNTVSIVESYQDLYPDNRVILIKNKTRSGKASGLNKGMQKINTELVMLVDARQEINADALMNLASWFYPGSKAGAVSGELKFRSEKVIGSKGLKSKSESGMDAYQKYEKFIRQTESVVAGVPGVSGAIYILRRDLFKPMASDTILDDVLIPMNAAKQGFWIGYDDRATAWDIPSNDMAREKQRKTRTLKGNYQLLFRHLGWCFPGSHPLWFQYFSHKVSRLTAPFFAIGALGISLSLSLQGSYLCGLFSLALIIGVSLYPLSLLYPKVNNISLLRIGASFVALNWFNLLGFFQYLFSANKQSWK